MSDQLLEVIKAAIPSSARRAGGHPAKRTFQALRIEVNSELTVLRRGLDAAVRWLNPQGRIAVISYHSLEDRIVKNIMKTGNADGHVSQDFFGRTDTPFRLINNKVIVPDNEEQLRNPRSRSSPIKL